MASIVRPTAGRAVHLRTSPRPSNLGESREILRLISQFGEVEYFKSLKHDHLPQPNTTLVIFKDESAAYECLKRSPIRFRMGKAAPVSQHHKSMHPEPSRPSMPSQEESPASPSPPSPGIAPAKGAWGVTQTRFMSTDSLPKPPFRAPQIPFQPPPLHLLESRIFQILVNPARAHFRDQINTGHYHGRFTINSKSIAQQDLIQTVPLPGLSCVVNPAWEGRHWRFVARHKEGEHEGPTRHKSLRELYEESSSGNKSFTE